MSRNAVKMKALIIGLLSLAVAATAYSLRFPSSEWLHFAICFCLVLLASQLGLRMPGGDTTVAINFPFILLAIITGSPLQAILITAASVALQCIRPGSHFTVEQAIFNVSNASVSTFAAWAAFNSTERATGYLIPASFSATVVYMTLNLVLVVRMVTWATAMSAGKLLRQGFLECVPSYLLATTLATSVAFISTRFNWSLGILILPATWVCYYTARLYMKRAEANC
jgi:hypothetical protein